MVGDVKLVDSFEFAMIFFVDASDFGSTLDCSVWDIDLVSLVEECDIFYMICVRIDCKHDNSYIPNRQTNFYNELANRLELSMLYSPQVLYSKLILSYSK